jgi:hypothetical protein
MCVWLTQGIAKSYRREKMVNTEVREEQLFLHNSLGHQEKRQDKPIDPSENSLVLSGSLAESAGTDRARQSTTTSFHINGRLITTHDLRHLFTPLILGDTDVSAGILESPGGHSFPSLHRWFRYPTWRRRSPDDKVEAERWTSWARSYCENSTKLFKTC